VRVLAETGAEVAYTYRSEPGDAPGHAAYQLDLADREAVEGFARGLEEGAGFDILVQVGGMTYDMLAAMMEQDAAERAMQVNFWSFTRIARAVVRPMIRARYGRIVAIGSVVGLQASQGNAAYAATKAALLGYVRTLAIETAKRGITVNYVAPGFVDTEMMAPFAAHRSATEARVPAGRYAAPEEIAAAVAFLASPAASYITGAVIPVDGGLTASIGVQRA
jgi:NAD(P)-dependent dehydrogenase (short-subunit alcohol dehydrogenase family)